MIQVYGIPNCDTVKKALIWLQENDIPYEFHNFKKEGVAESKLKEWVKASSLEKVLNKKSTAFRNLSTDDQQRTALKNDAIKLMQANTNLIKRPVVENAGIVLHGFNDSAFIHAFGKK